MTMVFLYLHRMIITLSQLAVNQGLPKSLFQYEISSMSKYGTSVNTTFSCPIVMIGASYVVI